MSSHLSWFGYILQPLEITGVFVYVQKLSECLWHCLEVVRFFQKFRYKSSMPWILEKSAGILSLMVSAHLNSPCLFRFVEDQLIYKLTEFVNHSHHGDASSRSKAISWKIKGLNL